MYYNLRFGFVFFVYDIDKKSELNRIELLIIKKDVSSELQNIHWYLH